LSGNSPLYCIVLYNLHSAGNGVRAERTYNEKNT